MIRRLAPWFAATLVMAAQCCAADLRGDWIFTPSAEFPEFTTLTLAGQAGSIRSLWYGELPLLNLHAQGERLIFQLDNGNPRLVKHDLVLTPTAQGLVLTGQLWDTSRSAATCGARPAISRTTTHRWRRSVSTRLRRRRMRARAAGTTRTCWKSAMAA